MGNAARFNSPYSIVIDSSGNLYVADAFKNAIRKISSTGNVSTIAGSAGVIGSTDGVGSAARFNSPYAIVFDSSGNLYIADSNNHIIRKMTSSGNVTTIAGSTGTAGSSDEIGIAARFNKPMGMVIDSLGNFYITIV